MKQVKVGFLSAHNYFDRNAWSGGVYRMYQALKSKGFQMVDLGNPEKPTSSLFKKIKNRLQPKTGLGSIGSKQYIEENKRFADKLQRQLQKNPCDVIFAPVASREVNLLNDNIPVIYMSDATPELIKDTYNLYPDEAGFMLADKREKSAISKATKIVYPSQWVANSAVNYYQANPNKIKVVTFGANIDPNVIPTVDQTLDRCNSKQCRLLFIGKDWQRKGGYIAFETLEILNQMGIDTELVFLGCIPPKGFQHEKMKVIPFLNKNIPEEQQQFSELLLNSHFLLFPTRADCSPFVICEANASGLPVITTDVGGIPTIVQNGKNGYTLPLAASGQDYANLIAQNFLNSSRYQQLVYNARQEYETRLNWDKWAQDVSEVIESVCSPVYVSC
ncbi:MAG: glycosyltransferase family 4 protein [Microcoleaceae cyanobacterium]